MSRLTHEAKVAAAKRLKIESGSHKPLFETSAWERRKALIARKHRSRNEREHARAVKKKADKEQAEAKL
jgi:multidrug resistance efflux pump